MFDFLRNFTKSAAEKQQEMLTAYVDDELSAAERRRFEQMMAQDESLRVEMERQRLYKQAIQELPRLSAPRNFILSKAEFQQAPAPQRVVQLYPALRTATALAGVFVIVVFVAGIFTTGRSLTAPAESNIALAPTEPAIIALDESAGQFAEEADRATEAEEVVEEELAEEAAVAEALAEEEPAEASDDTAAAESVDTAEGEQADDSDASGESAPGVPRPESTPTEPPRAEDIPSPATATVAATEVASAAPTIQAEQQPTEIEQVSYAQPPGDGLPWLPILAIVLFLLLLGITLIARRQKNNI